MFTITDLPTTEYSFLLGINDKNKNLIGTVHCSFIDGVSMSDTEIKDKTIISQRQYLSECSGYTPNIVSVTLESDLHPINFEDIIEKLFETVDYALIAYFQMVIPDLYICIDLKDSEVDILKLKGFDEAIGFDLYADENLLVLSRTVWL